MRTVYSSMSPRRMATEPGKWRISCFKVIDAEPGVDGGSLFQDVPLRVSIIIPMFDKEPVIVTPPGFQRKLE